MSEQRSSWWARCATWCKWAIWSTDEWFEDARCTACGGPCEPMDWYSTRSEVPTRTDDGRRHVEEWWKRLCEKQDTKKSEGDETA